MHRVLIIGTSGCGKSRLAAKLGAVLALPVHDLDDYYWLPQWHVRPQDAFIADIERIARQKHWVFAGNSRKSAALLEQADTIIWLDYSLPVCLVQAIKRSVSLMWRQQSCCSGNHESLPRFFSKDSIVVWILRSFKRRKIEYSLIFQRPVADKTYYRFRSKYDTESWLKSL